MYVGAITHDEKANQRIFLVNFSNPLTWIAPANDLEVFETCRTETNQLSVAVPYLMGCCIIEPILQLTV
jgi:hypothetical protein